MPDHCVNQLDLIGDKDERNRFVNELIVTDDWNVVRINLDKLIPASTYADQLKLWGTKWGCYDVVIKQHDEEKTSIFFNTAWSPYNLSIQREMSRAFPTLKFVLKFVTSRCC